MDSSTGRSGLSADWQNVWLLPLVKSGSIGGKGSEGNGVVVTRPGSWIRLGHCSF